jgi:hypothetical protein
METPYSSIITKKISEFQDLVKLLCSPPCARDRLDAARAVTGTINGRR